MIIMMIIITFKGANRDFYNLTENFFVPLCRSQKMR